MCLIKYTAYNIHHHHLITQFFISPRKIQMISFKPPEAPLKIKLKVFVFILFVFLTAAAFQQGKIPPTPFPGGPPPGK